MLEIIIALVSRITDLEKIVLALKADLEAVQKGATVASVAPDVAAQVESLATVAAETATGLGVSSSLSGSLLAMLGGVVQGVEGLFTSSSDKTPSDSAKPATAPAGALLPAPVPAVGLAAVQASGEGQPVAHDSGANSNAANAAANAGGVNA